MLCDHHGWYLWESITSKWVSCLLKTSNEHAWHRGPRRCPTLTYLAAETFKNMFFFLISERWCLCSLYLACIFASSAVASADHVCCDVSIKGVAAVTPCSWDNGHCDCPECDRHLASFQTIVAPPRHPTHVAFSYTCPLPGKRRQRHVFVQNHGSPQLDRKLYSFHVNMFFFLKKERCNRLNFNKPLVTFLHRFCGTLMSMMSALLVLLLYRGWMTKMRGLAYCSVPSKMFTL